MTLGIQNTGSTPFEWSGGLHPYWAVKDLLQCELMGLPKAGALRWADAPFEQLYDGCPALLLDCGECRLALSATGFTQWMVWNPGADGAKALTDLPPDDWRHFVCVEAVCATLPVWLQPGECFVGTLHAQLVEKS